MTPSVTPRNRAPPISGSDSTNPKPTKRNRITVACTLCRQRKSRCDGTRPRCSTCREHEYDCVYADAVALTKTSVSKEFLEVLELRLSALESSVTGLDIRVAHVEGSRDDSSETLRNQRQSQSSHPHDEFTLEGDENESIEIHDPADGMGSISFTKEEDSGFFGPSSNIAFTRQIVRTTTSILKASITVASPESPNYDALRGYMLHMSRPPSPAPERHHKTSPAFSDIDPFALPDKIETLQLIERYFNTTGVLFPYIDKETFLKTYQHLRSTNIRTVRRSWLGLLNMVLAMATHAGHNPQLIALEQARRSDMFYRRALALCDKEIRYSTSLEVVQLLLLMSQYLQGTERSIETWNVHGHAVKAAYQLGLHSPNALKQYPPLEREIRKRTWFGCVLLDRTLSMTLGRPLSIPDNFIKLDFPCALTLTTSSGTDSPLILANEQSVHFYTATISLYAILSGVLDVLYGSNLGFDIPDNVFDTTSNILQFEQKLLAWQLSLPPTLSLVEPSSFVTVSESTGLLRFRFILTVRFLNLRILAHRPILCQYLDLLGKSRPDWQRLAVLRQLGTNSIRICVQSALDIIRIMRAILCPPEPQQKLLGAWWFSLYYTFNAALVIFSTLLVEHQISQQDHIPVPEKLDLSVQDLHQSIECLSMLFKGNRMTEKCVQYTSSLAQLLSTIYRQAGSQETEFTFNTSTESSGEFPTHIYPEYPQNVNLFDFSDSSDLHMGMTLEDFFGPAFGVPVMQKGPNN